MFFPFPSVRRVKFDCQRLTRAFMSFFFFLPLLPSAPSVLSLSLSLSLSLIFFIFLFFLIYLISFSLALSHLCSYLYSSLVYILLLILVPVCWNTITWVELDGLETRTKAQSYRNSRRNNALRPSRKISTLTGMRNWSSTSTTKGSSTHE